MPSIPFHPRTGLYVITCIDPRVDPAAFLGLRLGDAIVQRDIGGRVTPAVARDVAYIAHLVRSKTPEGPWFEVAIVHHTDCGSALLADDDLRNDFAARIGASERDLADTAVLDPASTARTDVERLRAAPGIPDEVAIAGYVYDLATGVVAEAPRVS
ncbi:carbonic anhydrase [Actinoplanes sp. NPDC051411]|uniref:carbonic anhydrase n=1 Tax=Actinoplanes sp. NPDC051411 TaxID=3155522 RepID=UPI00344929EE